MSDDTLHSPGPWQTVRDNGIRTEIWELLGHDTLRIVFGEVDVAYCPAVDDDNGNANARLIAAAPDLLETCKGLLGELEGYVVLFEEDRGSGGSIEEIERDKGLPAVILEARAVIAKATPHTTESREGG